MYYRIAKFVLESQIRLPSFESFACEAAAPDVVLILSEQEPENGNETASGYIAQRKVNNGWFFHWPGKENLGLSVSADYKKLQLIGHKGEEASWLEEGFIQMALECFFVYSGLVSLHAACVELEEKALAFCGPSGTGKSTWARAWVDAFRAGLVSGDRPLIDVNTLEVYGVPWDGRKNVFGMFNIH